MSNKIKLIKREDETTYWIDTGYNTVYTIPVNKKFESENIDDIISALLSEFSHSDTGQKKKFELLLREWLSNTDDSSLDINKTEKIRDLIYEMF